jgi:hypothetical protein
MALKREFAIFKKDNKPTMHFSRATSEYGLTTDRALCRKACVPHSEEIPDTRVLETYEF